MKQVLISRNCVDYVKWKGFRLELSEVSKSRDSSDRYFTEAFMHSTFVIILYFTLFQEKKQTKKQTILNFTFRFHARGEEQP